MQYLVVLPDCSAASRIASVSLAAHPALHKTQTDKILQEDAPSVQPHHTKATLTMPRRKHDSTLALVISLIIKSGVEAACLLIA